MAKKEIFQQAIDHAIDRQIGIPTDVSKMLLIGSPGS